MSSVEKSARQRYRIHAVAELTGVPAVTLRAWERRYGVPRPARAPSAYRMYGPEDVALVERVIALRERGVPTSEAARRALAETSPDARDDELRSLAVARIVEAARRLSPEALRGEVARAMMLGDAASVFEDVFAPALARIGDEWAAGRLSVAHEHLASSVIGAAARTLVGLVSRPDAARTAIVACLAEEEHSLAATGVALRLATNGFRVVDLGARTPAAAIADAVGAARPSLVALSVTIAPTTAASHRLARAYADACGTVPWVVGGRGARGMKAAVERLGGRIETLDGLTNLVRTLYILEPRHRSPRLEVHPMFDVVVASTREAAFSSRVVQALRSAKLRVIACEVGPTDSPPSVFRVDAAVACAPTAPAVTSIARGLRATLDGPPPVVGVTRSPGSPPAGLADMLPDDAPAALLALRVQRAAAHGERKKSRMLLQGDLDDVGLRELVGSLASRRRTCLVKVRAGDRRAEIALDRGEVTHARADGLASTDAGDVAEAVAEWKDASFEVHGDRDGAPVLPTRERPTLRPPVAGDASEVALAAAVMNAVASYARAWLPADVVSPALDVSRTRAREASPGVDAFVVSPDGVVSVSSVTHARAAIPEAVATWATAFFDECGKTAPLRFRRESLPDVLGGLTKLVEQVGWGATLLSSQRVSR